jgi:hypothetical protein
MDGIRCLHRRSYRAILDLDHKFAVSILNACVRFGPGPL